MKKNVGNADKIIRIVLGLAVIVLGFEIGKLLSLTPPEKMVERSI